MYHGATFILGNAKSASLWHAKIRFSINTPKNGQLSQQKFFRRWLVSIKNLQSESKGSAFDSSWFHLGVFDVRVDQKDQKVDFEYPPQNLPVTNLGTRRSCERVIINKILIRQLYQKLNVEELWRINYLLTRSRSWVLVVPRLSRDLLFVHFGHFCPFHVLFSCNIISKVRASILEILACHTLTLFALPRI